jgi:hypothetical protein
VRGIPREIATIKTGRDGRINGQFVNRPRHDTSQGRPGCGPASAAGGSEPTMARPIPQSLSSSPSGRCRRPYIVEARRPDRCRRPPRKRTSSTFTGTIWPEVLQTTQGIRDRHRLAVVVQPVRASRRCTSRGIWAPDSKVARGPWLRWESVRCTKGFTNFSVKSA